MVHPFHRHFPVHRALAICLTCQTYLPMILQDPLPNHAAFDPKFQNLTILPYLSV
jgi:hypothetical protein